MKKISVQWSVFSAFPVLVLCTALLFPLVRPDEAGAAESDVVESGEPMLFAAEDSTLPVIPKVPERSRRAPRRAPGAAPAEEAPAPSVPSPATPPSSVPPPVVTTPAPVTPPNIAAPAPAPSPRVASPAPAPVVEDPLTEPVEPAPVVVQPKRPARQYQADSSSRPRKKRYDPKLVLDPSPAEPYVTREIYIDGPAPGGYGYRTDRPVWMVDVPTPGPGPAPVPVYGVPSPPPAGMVGAGTMIPGGGIPLHSTQNIGVSNPLPFEPVTYVSPQYGPPVGYGAGGVGGHGAYPGSIGSPWPSDAAVVYVDVPPERVSGNIGSERARHRYQQPPLLPEDHRLSRGTPTLSDDRIMQRNELEPDPYRERPLRPRR